MVERDKPAEPPNLQRASSPRSAPTRAVLVNLLWLCESIQYLTIIEATDPLAPWPTWDHMLRTAARAEPQAQLEGDGL